MVVLLTAVEVAALQLVDELADLLTAEFDNPDELTVHTTALQRQIMDQAEARSHPELFRQLGLRVVVPTGKIRVLRRFSHWHWWCPCCMGGDWFEYIGQAWRDAERHIEKTHSPEARTG